MDAVAAPSDTSIEDIWALLDVLTTKSLTLLRKYQDVIVTSSSNLASFLHTVGIRCSLYISQPDSIPVVATILVTLCLLIVIIKRCKVSSKTVAPSSLSTYDLTYKWSVFDLAKTAYESGHTEAVINIVEKMQYDLNSEIPANGLTLFLCACLSGKRQLIQYCLNKGGDVRKMTKAGDTALYLATFGVLGSPEPDIRVLEDIIRAGCDVNQANLGGYTALHRAAGHGNINVIQRLLKFGADPYQATAAGIYPIDCAINAGNLDAAELLKINVSNPHVWDVVEPHTPPHIRLGLQSPQRKHLMESTRRVVSPSIMSARRVVSHAIMSPRRVMLS